MPAWLDSVRKIKEKVLSANGNCRKVLPESTSSTDSSLFEDERFDGKWFLRTNTDFTPGQAALTYKDFWQVEHVFRDIKIRPGCTAYLSAGR